MSALPNILALTAVTGLGFLIYKSGVGVSPDESGETDQAGALAPASQFAQTSSKRAAWQSWTKRFSTSCGWGPTEEDCPQRDCIDSCYRLIKQTNMNLDTSSRSTGCLGDSRTPSLAISLPSSCPTLSNVYWLGEGGSPITVRAKRGAPVWFNDQPIEFEIDIQAFTDCERKSGMNGWAFSHFGRNRDDVCNSLSWVQCNLVNAGAYSLTMEDNTIEVPSTCNYENVTTGSDCFGHRYNDDTKCGGYSRYTFTVRPDLHPEPDKMVGNFSLSMKIRAHRQAEHCDFDEILEITVDDFLFILPAECRGSGCTSLGMSPNSNFDELKIVSSGNGYRVKDVEYDIPQWIRDMHSNFDIEKMREYDSYNESYLAEEGSSTPISLVSRNFFVSL